MAKAIFDVLFALIVSICNIVLAPINALLVTLFPDFSTMVTNFNNTVTIWSGNALIYVISLIPPVCKTCIAVYLTFLISYYTVSITIHAVLKVFTIIKRVKIW